MNWYDHAYDNDDEIMHTKMSLLMMAFGAGYFLEMSMLMIWYYDLDGAPLLVLNDNDDEIMHTKMPMLMMAFGAGYGEMFNAGNIYLSLFSTDLLPAIKNKDPRKCLMLTQGIASQLG